MSNWGQLRWFCVPLAFRRLYEQVVLRWVYAITKYKPLSLPTHHPCSVWYLVSFCWSESALCATKEQIMVILSLSIPQPVLTDCIDSWCSIRSLDQILPTINRCDLLISCSLESCSFIFCYPVIHELKESYNGWEWKYCRAATSGWDHGIAEKGPGRLLLTN